MSSKENGEDNNQAIVASGSYDLSRQDVEMGLTPPEESGGNIEDRVNFSKILPHNVEEEKNKIARLKRRRVSIARVINGRQGFFGTRPSKHTKWNTFFKSVDPDEYVAFLPF